MQKAFDKIIERLELELSLAEKEKERCVIKCLPYYENVKGYATATHNAIDIVKEVAEEFGKDTNVCRKDGWIPCSERLPDEPEFVDDSYIVQQSYIEKPFSANWDGKEWFDDEGLVLDQIIAWQPLPESYKE